MGLSPGESADREWWRKTCRNLDSGGDRRIRGGEGGEGREGREGGEGGREGKGGRGGRGEGREEREGGEGGGKGGRRGREGREGGEGGVTRHPTKVGSRDSRCVVLHLRRLTANCARSLPMFWMTAR